MRGLAFLVGVGVGVLGGACVDVPAPSCEDFDEDGWSCATSLPDCNENNREINPGANDICGNDIDEDCSGADLEDCELAIPAMGTSDNNVRLDVYGDDWELAIERSYGYAITSMRQGGQEILLGGGDALRGVGVAISPTVAQWDTNDGQLQDLATGAAVIHRWARWEFDEGFGFTYVTIFPDGRIHRRDRVDLSSAVDGTTFSTYASFSHPFDVVRWPGLSTPVPASLPLHREGTTDETGAICALDDGFGTRAAMLWVVDPSQPAAPTIDAVAGRLTLSYDWLRGVTSVPAGSYRATTMLIAGRDDPPGAPACTFDDIATQLATPAAMTIHAGRAADTDDDDGDGYDVDLGLYRVAADGADHVEVELGAAPGPGIGVRVETSAPGVTVWRDGVRLEAGRDYLSQFDPWLTDSVHIYLRGPIAAGTRYWIAGPGGEP